MKKTVSKSVATKLTSLELQKINNIVDIGMYLNSSDFLREAVREKLKAIEVINIRDIDYETAKKEVLEYHETHETAYISEISENLKLDLSLTVNIIDELIKKGKIEEVS
ncbi:MAG: hypothetical protein FWH29_07845 [Methanobrevibacter sp.]|nr:hypothetical protein [Methanobrevibacter sp.]